jgi:ElaB/YqjD/DUF883 family membrane-anchored ribosome-binding protein
MKNKTEQALDDLHKLVADLEALFKSATGAAAEQAGEAREKLSAGLAEARERLASVDETITDGVKHGAQRADRYLRDNPWPAIGIVAAGAFLLGVLLSRRR